MAVCLVSVVSCQVEVSATGWSLVQGSSTECDVSEYDREASIIRKPWPIRCCCVIAKKIVSCRYSVVHDELQITFCIVLLYLYVLRPTVTLICFHVQLQRKQCAQYNVYIANMKSLHKL
jgi:hypothetical protein